MVESPQVPGRWRIRLVRLALALVAAFVLVVVGGYVAGPALVRSQLEARLGVLLGRSVSIGAVEVEPLRLAATVRGFEIKQADGVATFVAIERLRVDVEARSLLRWATVVSELTIERPRVELTRHEDGRYSIDDILQRVLAPPPPGTESDAPARFAIANIRVIDGAVVFDDRPVGRRHELKALALGVPFLSNIAEHIEAHVAPELSGELNGRRFGLDGRTLPFKEHAEARLEFDTTGIDLPFYLAYLPRPLPVAIPKGTLDTALSLEYVEGHGVPRLQLAGRMTVRDLAVDDRRGAPLARLPEVEIVIKGIDVVGGSAQIESVTLARPTLELAIDRGGRINLLAPFEAEGQAAAETARPEAAAETARPEAAAETARPEAAAAVGASARSAPLLTIAKIAVADGTLHVHDASVAPAFAATLEGVGLAVGGFSTALGNRFTVEATARMAPEATLSATGAVGLDPSSAEIQLTLAGHELARYAPYYAPHFAGRVVGGTLGGAMRLRFVPSAALDTLQVDALGLEVAGLKLRLPGGTDDVLSATVVRLADGLIEMSARRASFGSILLDRGTLQVQRTADGGISLMRLLPAEELPQGASSTSPAGAAAGPGAAPASPKERRAAAEAAWTTTIGSFAAQRFLLQFEDLTNTEPVRLAFRNLDLRLRNVSTAPGARVGLALATAVDPGGKASAKGTLVLEPLSLAADVEYQGLPLPPLSPYFDERVGFFMTGGTISGKGHAEIALPDVGDPSARYKGDLVVGGFACVDKLKAEELLSFKSLAVAGGDFTTTPMAATVASMALADFYARVTVFEDGQLNLWSMFGPPAPAPPDEDETPVSAAPSSGPHLLAAERDGEVFEAEGRVGGRGRAGGGPSAADPPRPSGAGPAVPSPATGAPTAATPSLVPMTVTRIAAITLQGGVVDFDDRLIRPNFRARLSEVGGRVTGISSVAGELGDLDLRASLGGYAPLTISGRINPFEQTAFADIKATFRDMELSPVTPYAFKYFGYKIEKGRLSFDVTYRVENRRLKAENKVVLDQLTLGEKVESKDATNLPVRLAISLLKDRDGRIDLDIPIEGSLDDPRFRVGKVVWRIIRNIFVKVASSPFALLGSMFGGKEAELNVIEFAPGIATLDETARGRLDTVAKALVDRPALRLDVEGRAEPEQDGIGLQRKALADKVHAAKVRVVAKKGGAEGPVVVESAEYEEYLRAAYKAEKFPKPRTAIGTLKTLPVEEMEKLILANVTVSADDLRQLGLSRATAVKNHLLAHGVAAERIFVVEPKVVPPGTKEKAPLRAELTLK